MKEITVTNQMLATMGNTALLLFILPLVFLFVWKRKKGSEAALKPFFIGMIGFFVCARILELGVHMFCIIADNPVSRFINGHTAAYVIYGVLMAGIFEEVGKYFILKYLMKNNRTRENMVMYGIGHGGIEVWVISFAQILTYLAIGASISLYGTKEGLAAMGMPAGAEASVALLLDTIAGFTFSYGLMVVLERISCMFIHISLTIFVFRAVEKSEKKYLFFAVLAHMVLDLVPALSQRITIPIAFTEGYLVVCAVVLTYFARKLYLKRD